MDNQESDLQTLRTLVRDLVARVERLERSAETRATAASDPSLYAEIQPSEVPLTPSRPALSQVPATETPAMPPQANTLPAMPLAPPRFTPRDSGPQFDAAKPVAVGYQLSVVGKTKRPLGHCLVPRHLSLELLESWV